MDPLAALARGATPAEVSLDGHPLGWLRAPPGWDTGRRTLDLHLLFLLESGEMDVEIADGRHLLGPGWALLVPPGVPFRARGGRRRPVFWRLRMALPAPWPAGRAIAGCHELEPVMAALVAEAGAGRARDLQRAAAVRGGLLLLLAGLARRCAADRGRRLTAAQQVAVERHAEANPRATPRELARVLGLTPDYATRLFRATFGQPPRRWLLERRMHAAAVALVEGGEPLSALARRHGCADERVFGRQFRQVLGLPPARFRRRFAAAPR